MPGDVVIALYILQPLVTIVIQYKMLQCVISNVWQALNVCWGKVKEPS